MRVPEKATRIQSHVEDEAPRGVSFNRVLAYVAMFTLLAVGFAMAGLALKGANRRQYVPPAVVLIPQPTAHGYTVVPAAAASDPGNAESPTPQPSDVLLLDPAHAGVPAIPDISGIDSLGAGPAPTVFPPQVFGVGAGPVAVTRLTPNATTTASVLATSSNSVGTPVQPGANPSGSSTVPAATPTPSSTPAPVSTPTPQPPGSSSSQGDTDEQPAPTGTPCPPVTASGPRLNLPKCG